MPEVYFRKTERSFLRRLIPLGSRAGNRGGGKQLTSTRVQPNNTLWRGRVTFWRPTAMLMLTEVQR